MGIRNLHKGREFHSQVQAVESNLVCDARRVWGHLYLIREHLIDSVRQAQLRDK